MQQILCNNFRVAKDSEKKTAALALKIEPSVKELIEKIAREQLRTTSQVAGFLIVRGLSLYAVDGLLKGEPISSENGKVVAAISPGSMEETRRIYQKNVELLEDSKNKPRKVKHLGEVGEKDAEKKRKTG